MANINSTSLRNNLVQSLTMSGDLTWAKADFKGKFTVFLSATGSTRTLTISNTGFVAGDFICLLINQYSAVDVSVTIGTRLIANNRGNIINGLFDGTNWIVWSGGGVFNTSSSEFDRTSFGLRATASGNTASAFGQNSTASGTGASAFGSSSISSASSSSAFGSQATASASNTTAIGAISTANGAESIALGRTANTNSFVRSNAFGAYTVNRRYGSTRTYLGTGFSATDATNPSQNKEWATWNGTTANNTITEIFLRGVSSNRCVLQAKNVIAFKGQAVAFKSDYTGSARWSIEGLIKRNNGNNTTLIGVTATLTHSDGTGDTLVLTITADDTNEALKVEVTGNASETWTWGVELELLDLRIA